MKLGRESDETKKKLLISLLKKKNLLQRDFWCKYEFIAELLE
jgi:hypothetical protein